MSELRELFGEPIHVVTRAQALQDGTLADVTEWASSGPNGMLGGFRVPVAVTASVWSDLNDIPAWAEGLQSLRGRAHDLLWMASLAARSGSGSERAFEVILALSGDPDREDDEHEEEARLRTYKLVCGPDDGGAPCITIMQPDED